MLCVFWRGMLGGSSRGGQLATAGFLVHQVFYAAPSQLIGQWLFAVQRLDL